MTRIASLSVSAVDSGLGRYIDQIRRIPLLEAEEEFLLAKRYREGGDRDAVDRLVNSHLRLVVKIASGHRGYGLPIAELISEGNIGLMRALERFDPDKGFRFATYAVWWIRAAMQQFILHSKSIVKMGTTKNQKTLFFNLRKAKSRISALADGDMRPDQVELIAERLGVTGQDVIEMNRRLSGDVSLNAPLNETEPGALQDLLADEAPSQEHILADSEEMANGRTALAEALRLLNERERRIFVSRRLAETPKKLDEIAGEFGVSRERVRQIEMKAFDKVRKAVMRRAETTPAAELAAA